MALVTGWPFCPLRAGLSLSPPFGLARLSPPGQAKGEWGKDTMIDWTLKALPIDSLTDFYKNPRQLTAAQHKHLSLCIERFGLIDKPVVNADEVMKIIDATRKFVGHYRIGRLNRNAHSKTIDWNKFAGDVTRHCLRHEIPYFIKKELLPYLPAGVPDVYRCQRP